jgi:hypothetical protein
VGNAPEPENVIAQSVLVEADGGGGEKSVGGVVQFYFAFSCNPFHENEIKLVGNIRAPPPHHRPHHTETPTPPPTSGVRQPHSYSAEI